MGADAQRAEPAREAHCGVDVARYGPAPAEVVAVEVEVVLEVELVDECRDLGPLSDGFDDRELDRGRVDVDLGDDEVLRAAATTSSCASMAVAYFFLTANLGPRRARRGRRPRAAPPAARSCPP